MNLLFVAHGSRLPAYQEDAQAFVAAWLERNPSHKVELCYLELMEPSFKAALTTAEVDAYIVPLFLHEGWHKKYDVTAAISATNKTVSILAIFKDNRPIIEALHTRLLEAKAIEGSVVIYSHGNSRDQSHLDLHQLTSELNAQSAFKCDSAVARGEPGLESVLQKLIESGERNITIVPHFLFRGAWQTKMYDIVQEIYLTNDIQINVAQPLQAHPGLIEMINAAINDLQ